MSIQSLAGKVDFALNELATAIEALATEAKKLDKQHRAQHHGHPSPAYESIGDKIRAAAGSIPALALHLGVPVTRGATSLRALFPQGD